MANLGAGVNRSRLAQKRKASPGRVFRRIQQPRLARESEPVWSTLRTLNVIAPSFAGEVPVAADEHDHDHERRDVQSPSVPA
jgi:hypothetical protein